MSEPIVMISHFRVKKGRIDEWHGLAQKYIASLKAENPGSVAHLHYVDGDGTRLTIVNVFADADAADFLVAGADERRREAFDVLEPEGLELCGQASDGLMEMVQKTAETAGVPIDHRTQYTGGFVRPTGG